jgi:hypothetical protein
MLTGGPAPRGILHCIKDSLLGTYPLGGDRDQKLKKFFLPAIYGKSNNCRYIIVESAISK